MAEPETYDAIVIGGGPAGLAGALWLARYRRRVRVFDAEDPRNAATWGVHGYLGLKDPPPEEIRRIGREQALEAGAEYEAAAVARVEGEKDDFTVHLEDGRAFRARRLLLATGLRDIIPEIPGLLDFYGSTIFHCPDCDGPSVGDCRIGVIGWGRQIVSLCAWMLTWSRRLTVLTHGHPPDLDDAGRRTLERHGIAVREEVIERLEGEGGQVRRAVFHGGGALEVDAVFFHIASGSGSPIAAELGVEVDEDAVVQVDDEFETSVPGVYAAGDLTPGARLVIRAAYEGTRAAIGIQKSFVVPERMHG
jgi:thioredoxin reductase